MAQTEHKREGRIVDEALVLPEDLQSRISVGELARFALNLRKQVGILSRQNQITGIQLEQEAIERARLAGEVENMQRSLSWRLTRPLRMRGKIFNFFKKIKTKKTDHPVLLEPKQQIKTVEGEAGEILIIVPTLPTPLCDSGSLRLLEICKLLICMRCRVSIVSEEVVPNLELVESLGEEGLKVILPSANYDLLAAIADNPTKYRSIILSRPDVAERYIEAVRKYQPQAKVLFDTVDLHYLREAREALLGSDAQALAASRVRKEQELQSVRNADYTIVVSEYEREILVREGIRSECLAVISNIHPVEPTPANWEERRGILFVGGFRHQPNIDAVCYLAREIMPVVWKRDPEIELLVVGSYPTAEVNSLACDKLSVLGFVEELMPVYNQVRLSVSPLRYGAGVKGKVGMSLAYGVPAVVTPIAAEGMGEKRSEALIVADGVHQFAHSVVDIYHDKVGWNRARDNGISLVADRFSTQRAKDVLAMLLGI